MYSRRSYLYKRSLLDNFKVLEYLEWYRIIFVKNFDVGGVEPAPLRKPSKHSDQLSHAVRNSYNGKNPCKFQKKLANIEITKYQPNFFSYSSQSYFLL